MVNTKAMTEEMAKELAFTKEDREELKRMKEMEIVFFDDCPEVTPQKAIRFKRVNLPKANVKPSAQVLIPNVGEIPDDVITEILESLPMEE